MGFLRNPVTLIVLPVDDLGIYVLGESYAGNISRFEEVITC